MHFLSPWKVYTSVCCVYVTEDEYMCMCNMYNEIVVIIEGYLTVCVYILLLDVCVHVFKPLCISTCT